ncbi:MAG: hypothetical protein WD048_12475 [Chitinophagales bacterium]
MIELKNNKKPSYYMRKPNFWDGLASLFDLYNARSIKLDLSFDEDIKAMKSDFDMVGHDLWYAVKKFDHLNEKLLKSKGDKIPTV